MANLYKRYMRLLNSWPLDNNKSPDLGQFIREQVKAAFPKGEKSVIKDEKECLKQLESLERLASNYYGKKYPVNLTNTSTGLKLEVLSAALTPEMQKLFQEQKKGFVAKLQNTISKYFSKTTEEVSSKQQSRVN